MSDDARGGPCPFCEIAGGAAPAHVVYADATVTAFLDRNPINPGHLLVVPNRHVADFFDLDDDTLCHLMRVAKRLAAAVEAATHPRKVGLVVAGFDVPHAHVHLIPMHEYHDITSKKMLEGTRTRPSVREQEITAAALRAALAPAP